MTGLLVLCAGVGSSFFSVPASGQTVSADAVKATFLFRFSGYVEWPSPFEESPYTIGVVDNPEIAAQLDRLLPTITVNGRPARVRKLRGDDSLDGIHALYIGASTSINARLLREAAIKRPILLVSESPRGLADGAVINFLSSPRNVKFEVSLSNAERSGLKIDSRLLSVATRVEGMIKTSHLCGEQSEMDHGPRCTADHPWSVSLTSIKTRN